MLPVHLGKTENLLELVLRSSDGLVDLTFFMDFHEERLRFDWQTGIKARDNGTPNAALIQAELTRFTRDYIGNGQIHIRSEEHTSELQSLMSISYAVFCLKKKINKKYITYTLTTNI